VGTDDLADQALTGPRSAGVDLAAVRRVPLDTGLATILVDHAGTKTMIFAPGANDAFSNADGQRLAAEVHGASPGSVLVVDTEVSPAALLPALQAVWLGAHDAQAVVVFVVIGLVGWRLAHKTSFQRLVGQRRARAARADGDGRAPARWPAGPARHRWVGAHARLPRTLCH
jgi:sugar/nucleoside kinase (ribokinase family)